MLELFKARVRRLSYRVEDILTCVLPRGYYGCLDVNVGHSPSVCALGHGYPSVAPSAVPVRIEHNTEFMD